MTSVHFCVLCILFYFWPGLQLMTDFIWLSVIKEPVSHSGSGNLLLLGILQRERQHRYVRHAVQSLSLISSACRIEWRWRRIYPPPFGRYHLAVAHPALKVTEKLKVKPACGPRPPDTSESSTVIPPTASVKYFSSFPPTTAARHAPAPPVATAAAVSSIVQHCSSNSSLVSWNVFGARRWIVHAHHASLPVLVAVCLYAVVQWHRGILFSSFPLTASQMTACSVFTVRWRFWSAFAKWGLR